MSMYRAVSPIHPSVHLSIHPPILHSYFFQLTWFISDTLSWAPTTPEHSSSGVHRCISCLLSSFCSLTSLPPLFFLLCITTVSLFCLWRLQPDWILKGRSNIEVKESLENSRQGMFVCVRVCMREHVPLVFRNWQMNVSWTEKLCYMFSQNFISCIYLHHNELRLWMFMYIINLSVQCDIVTLITDWLSY